VCRDALSKVRQSVPVHVALGRFYENAGRLTEALEQYEAALAVEKHVWAYLSKGQLQTKMGDYAKAIDTYKEAISRAAPFGQIYSGLANLQEQMGQLSEAELIFQEGRQKNPLDGALWVEHCEFLERRGRWSEAEASYRLGMAKMPRDAGKLYLGLVRALEKQEKLSEAEDVLRHALRLYPKWPALLLKAGEFFRTYGDAVSQECQLDIVLADLRERQGELDLAEAVLRNSVRLHPDSVDAYVALGQFLERKQQESEAEGLYREAIERRPCAYQAYVALANLLTDKKDSEQTSTTEPQSGPSVVASQS
jgi:tetratricopeptide (TPR) repeat protein